MARIVFIGETEVKISPKEYEMIREKLFTDKPKETYIMLNDCTIATGQTIINLNNVLYIDSE